MATKVIGLVTKEDGGRQGSEEVTVEKIGEKS